MRPIMKISIDSRKYVVELFDIMIAFDAADCQFKINPFFFMMEHKLLFQ